jgi:hypothetical protein
MFDITLRRPSPPPRDLHIVPVEAAVILDQRSPEGPNSPYTESLPINTARESFQSGLRKLADIAVIVIRPLYGLNKVQLRLARAAISADLTRSLSSL